MVNAPLRQRSLCQTAKFGTDLLVSHLIPVVAARVIGHGDLALAAFCHNLDTTRNFFRELACQRRVFLDLYPVDQLVDTRIAQSLMRKKLVTESPIDQNRSNDIRQAVISGLARSRAPLLPLSAGYVPCELVGI